MYQVELFLGFPVCDFLSKNLESLNPHLYDLFVSEKEEYLRVIEQGGVCYLGKFLGKLIEENALKLAEENVLSILKKMVPDFPFNPDSFILFPVAHDSP